MIATIAEFRAAMWDLVCIIGDVILVIHLIAIPIFMAYETHLDKEKERDGKFGTDALNRVSEKLDYIINKIAKREGR